MDTRVAELLLHLNREFYQTFSAPFIQTRERLQPGVTRIARMVPQHARLLDLGCGPGQLARHLATESVPRSYLGLDLSLPLLQRALARLADTSATDVHFVVATLDLASLPIDRAARFDWVFLFAVLHHLPGYALRASVCQMARAYLPPAGALALSNWQFTRSQRLRRRIVPWSQVGLDESDVDPGDALLDWRRGGSGLRYVHLIDEAERARLCREAGFREVEAFSSDGEGGRLSDYAIWQAQ
jgi:tRNA (uracil-5-)-methyltransferase TRM9